MPELKDICSALFAQPSGAELSRPAGGKILIAEPFLDENIFSHSVVSLLDYEPAGGAMGVVLNHKAHTTLGEVLEDTFLTRDVPVYCGGPLARDLIFFLHTLGRDIIPDARPYIPGMYVGGDFDAIIEYINSGYGTEGAVRFFIGYSSWDEAQLESEIASGTWALADAPADASSLLTGHGDAMWHRAVRSLGKEYRSWRLVPRLVCSN